VSARPKNGSIAFQPRARILKLIGEELISDEVVAVSELVKNSHDADATTVIVRFRGVTGPEGQIEVTDDGCGIDLNTLLGRWMEPAASTKVGKGRQVTRRGRRVLGEKGVGRFAADKLARHLEIVSRCPGQPNEVQAVVDWDRYDTDERMLAEVENRWESREASQISGHGTVLRLSGLRSVWTERMFRRLCIRLCRLLSPFRDRDEFTIRFDSDEFPDYSGDLRADFVQRAPYRVMAEFDGVQTISIALNGRRAVGQRWNGQGDLTCGPVRVKLFVFDLEGESLARIGPRMEVRAWPREWTGLSIYRDGFRVWPYGEPHDDWLRLDQRRVNNPVEHLSNNQVIGFIDIGRDTNPDLMDQTNREGLIHNQALEDLRRLVYFVIQAIEAERQSIRHPAGRVSESVRVMQSDGDTLGAELERLAVRVDGKIGQELRALGGRLEAQVVREAARLRQMIDGYAGLAAIGQMATGLMPAIPAELGHMRQELNRLREILVRHRIPEARQAFSALEKSLDWLGQYNRLLLGATGGGDRRRTIDVRAELETFHGVITPLLVSRGVEMDIVCQESGVLRTEMRPEHFLCLMQILTSNSLDWLRDVETPRIRVNLTAGEAYLEITFSDNGPGVPDQIRQLIFNPLFTRKEGGRGMGLAIARQVVETHGGHIFLLKDGRRRGAHLRIMLPRKRPRATTYGAS
jgi:signal transduction histidine kinase